MPKGVYVRTTENKANIAAAAKRRWADPAEHKAQSERMTDRFADPDYRALRSRIATEVQPKIQGTLLERYGAKFALQIPENCPTNIAYWLARGVSEDEAIARISAQGKYGSSLRRTSTSVWRASYWMSRGYTEEAAFQKVSEIQSANSRRNTEHTVSAECTVFLDAIEKVSGIQIAREVQLLDRFTVDGLAGTTVVEYFGSFWHMHPSLFAPQDVNKRTGWRAEAKWAEDHGRIKCMRSAGYTVFCVWDIEATDEKVAEIARHLVEVNRC